MFFLSAVASHRRIVALPATSSAQLGLGGKVHLNRGRIFVRAIPHCVRRLRAPEGGGKRFSVRSSERSARCGGREK